MKNSTENELFCIAILFVFDVVKLLFLTWVRFVQNIDIQWDITQEGGRFSAGNQVHLFVHLVNAVKCLNLPFCRKEKPLIMIDYQRFMLNCFLFEWSAWFVNLAVYSPKNQYLRNYKLCTCHVLVLKNCPLLSCVCLLISWVQKYGFFLNYANIWFTIFRLWCKVQTISIYRFAPYTKLPKDN